MNTDELNSLGKQALHAAFRVHTVLGPGLLESAYTACLVHELRKAGLFAETEVPIPLVYEGVKLSDVGYRADILLAGALIIEVKAIEVIAPVHLAQLISYLKLSQRKLGFLLNFNVEHMKDGIYRRVHGFGRD